MFLQFTICIIHILYTGCAKIEKNNSGAKRLKERTSVLQLTYRCSYNLQLHICIANLHKSATIFCEISHTNLISIVANALYNFDTQLISQQNRQHCN